MSHHSQFFARRHHSASFETRVTHMLEKIMADLDDLETNVTSLTDAVSNLSNAMAAETNLLSQQHAELVAALNQTGNSNPRIRAAADAIAQRTMALQAIAKAAQDAIAGNPDPAAALPTNPVDTTTPPVQGETA